MFSVHPEPGHRDPCIGPTRTGCNRCARGRSLTETLQRSGVATPRIWVNPTNGAGNSSLYHGNNTDLVIFTRKRLGSTSTTLDSSNGQMTATIPCAPRPYGLARIRPPQRFPHTFPSLAGDHNHWRGFSADAAATGADYVAFVALRAPHVVYPYLPQVVASRSKDGCVRKPPCRSKRHRAGSRGIGSAAKADSPRRFSAACVVTVRLSLWTAPPVARE